LSSLDPTGAKASHPESLDRETSVARAAPRFASQAQDSLAASEVRHGFLKSDALTAFVGWFVFNAETECCSFCRLRLADHLSHRAFHRHLRLLAARVVWAVLEVG